MQQSPEVTEAEYIEKLSFKFSSLLSSSHEKKKWRGFFFSWIRTDQTDLTIQQWASELPGALFYQNTLKTAQMALLKLFFTSEEILKYINLWPLISKIFYPL